MEAKTRDAIVPAQVEAFELRTNPRWLRVCDIKQPRTGLEVKFSYNWLAGMALRGDATGDDRVYTDALANDAELAAFASRVCVAADDRLSDLQAEAVLRLSDGREIAMSHDLAAPLAEDVLAAKLREKSIAMIDDYGHKLWDKLPQLDTDLDARQLGAWLRGTGPD